MILRDKHKFLSYFQALKSLKKRGKITNLSAEW